MNQESVIVTTLKIDRSDQVVHFQIKIPRAVSRIIGVETGVLWNSVTFPKQEQETTTVLPMDYKRQLLFGELKLQTLEQTNICYTMELTQNNNLKYADFTNVFFNPQPYTHLKQRHEDSISLDGNITILQGLYKNTIPYTPPYAYTVHVYIWLESTP